MIEGVGFMKAANGIEVPVITDYEKYKGSSGNFDPSFEKNLKIFIAKSKKFAKETKKALDDIHNDIMINEYHGLPRSEKDVVDLNGGPKTQDAWKALTAYRNKQAKINEVSAAQWAAATEKTANALSFGMNRTVAEFAAPWVASAALPTATILSNLKKITDAYGTSREVKVVNFLNETLNGTYQFDEIAKATLDSSLKQTITVAGVPNLKPKYNGESHPLMRGVKAYIEYNKHNNNNQALNTALVNLRKALATGFKTLVESIYKNTNQTSYGDQFDQMVYESSGQASSDDAKLISYGNLFNSAGNVSQITSLYSSVSSIISKKLTTLGYTPNQSGIANAVAKVEALTGGSTTIVSRKAPVLPLPMPIEEKREDGGPGKPNYMLYGGIAVLAIGAGILLMKGK